VGIVPDNEFLLTCNVDKVSATPSVDGIVPVNEFQDKYMVLMAGKEPIDSGRVPVKELRYTLRYVNVDKVLSEEGKVPANPLESSTIDTTCPLEQPISVHTAPLRQGCDATVPPDKQDHSS